MREREGYLCAAAIRTVVRYRRVLLPSHSEAWEGAFSNLRLKSVCSRYLLCADTRSRGGPEACWGRSYVS